MTLPRYRRRKPTWKAPAQVIIDYVVNDWPWAEAPPEKVMEALRALDNLIKGKQS